MKDFKVLKRTVSAVGVIAITSAMLVMPAGAANIMPAQGPVKYSFPFSKDNAAKDIENKYGDLISWNIHPADGVSSDKIYTAFEASAVNHSFEKGEFYKATAMVKADSGTGGVFAYNNNLSSYVEISGKKGFISTPYKDAAAAEAAFVPLTGDQDENGWQRVTMPLIYVNKTSSGIQFAYTFKNDRKNESVNITDVIIEKLDTVLVTEDMPNQVEIPMTGNTAEAELSANIMVDGALIEDYEAYTSLSNNAQSAAMKYSYELDGKYPGVSVEGSKLCLTDEVYARDDIDVIIKYNDVVYGKHSMSLICPQGYTDLQARNPRLIGALTDNGSLRADYSFYCPQGYPENKENAEFVWYGKTENGYEVIEGESGDTYTWKGVSPYSEVYAEIVKVENTNGDVSYLTDVKTAAATAPLAPTASNVGITGIMEINKKLTATFDWEDKNNDPEGEHIYKWFVADDKKGTNKLQIQGLKETENFYTIPSDLAGKYIQLEVTPVSISEHLPMGTPKATEWYLIHGKNLMKDPGKNVIAWAASYPNVKHDSEVLYNGNASISITAPEKETTKKWYSAPISDTTNVKMAKGEFYRATAMVKADSGVGIITTNSAALAAYGEINGVAGFFDRPQNNINYKNAMAVPLTGDKDSNGWQEISNFFLATRSGSDTVMTYNFKNDYEYETVYISALRFEKINPEFISDENVNTIEIPTAGNTTSAELNARIRIEGIVFEDYEGFEATSNTSKLPTKYSYELSEDYDGVLINGNTIMITDEAYEREIDVKVKYNDVVYGMQKIKFVCQSGNENPQIRNPKLCGGIAEGSTLTASYHFYDPKNTAENESAVQCIWEGKVGGTWQIISGVSGKSYTLTSADIAAYSSVRVKITSVNADGIYTEEAVTNEALPAQLPTASNVGIIGDISNKGTARAVFDYFDANDDAQGAHEYAWYIADDEKGTNEEVIQGAVNAEYIIPDSSHGKYIRVVVTPKSVFDTTGTEPESSRRYLIETENLLPNGDFEENADGWNVHSGTSSVASKDDICTAYPKAAYNRSKNGMRVKLGNTATPNVQTDITFDKGAFYKVKLMVRLESVKNTSDKIYLGVGGNTDTVYTYTNNLNKSKVKVGTDAALVSGGDYGTLLTTEWQPIEAYISAARAGTAKLVFNIAKNAGIDYPNIYIDDIKVYKLTDTPLSVSINSEIPIVAAGESDKEYKCSAVLNVDLKQTKPAAADVRYTLKDAYTGMSIVANRLKITDKACAGNYILVGTYRGAVDEYPFVLVNNTGSDVPEARNVTLTGNVVPGALLNVTYDFYDPNGKTEDESRLSVVWYGKTMSVDWTKLDSSVMYGKTVTVPSGEFPYDELKAAISVSNGEKNSVIIETNPVAVPSKPIASDVVISGKHFVGEVLTGEYRFYDRNISDKEAQSIYHWYRGDSAAAVPVMIEKATEKTYTITSEDIGKFLKFEVTPVSNDNSIYSVGEPAMSADSFEGPVPPSVTTAEILGTAKVGNTVSVQYDYFHKYGAPEDINSGTVITWYNASGKAIGTGKSLKLEDTGSIYVTVKVKSAYEPFDGNEVTSKSINVTSASSGKGGSGSNISSSFGSGASPSVNKPKDKEPADSTDVKAFDDIKNHWAKAQIEALVEKGFIKGVSENEFEPDRPVSRAEFCALICRIFEIKDYDEAAAYSDVLPEDWYFSYVQAATKAGIVSGFDGKFNPGDEIERQAMAKMITAVIESKKGEVKAEKPPEYTDMDSVSDWAVKAVSYLSEIGILQGSDGRVNPTSSATRAEAAVILSRLIDLLK